MVEDALAYLAFCLIWLPAGVLLLAWMRSHQFYATKHVDRPYKVIYVAALVLASFSTLAYMSYWCVWACEVRHVSVPLWGSLALGQIMGAGIVISAVAIVGVLVGRGPYRVLVGLASAWVLLELWIKIGTVGGD